MNCDQVHKLQPGHRASTPEHAGDGSSRILVVEDDDLVLAAVTRRLVRLGYSVVGVSSAKDAMAVLTAGNVFEYLLADIMLTGRVTGMMLAEQVRSLWPAIGIALMTGYQEFALPDSDCSDGFPLLLKPFASADLVHVLDRLATVAV